MIRFYTMIVALLVGAVTASADPLAERFGALPSIDFVQISPEGEQLAFVQSSEDGVNVIVYNLVDMTPSARIPVTDLKVRQVRWASEDRIILNVSNTSGYSRWTRGRFEYSAAYVIDLERESIRQLVIGTEGVWANQPGLGNVVGVHREGGLAYMPVRMRIPNRSEPAVTLLEVSLTHGRGRVAEYGRIDTIDFVVNSEGEALARENYDNDSNRYQLQVPGVNSTWRTVLEETSSRIPYALIGIMPDDQTLVVWANPESTRTAGLYTLNPDTDELEPVDRETEGRVTESFILDKNRHVIAYTFEGVRPSYDFLDDDIDAAYASLTQQLRGATASLESFSDDLQKLIFRIETGMGGAGAYVLLDRQTGEIRVLANSYSQISPEQTGAVYTFEYEARDGLPIEAIVTWPPGLRSSQRADLPLVLLPHGGPAAYDRIVFDYMAQYFANLGYAVLQPNFRGSRGYGPTFEQAGNGEWGGAMQEDLIDGIEAIAARGWVDAERVCIVGWSYGGYAALAGGAFDSDRFECVIAGAPVADLNQFLRERRWRYGGNSTLMTYWNEVIGEGEPDRAMLAEMSPTNHASNFHMPVLILHGDDDTVVEFAQSETMVDALEAAGADVTFVRLQDEDHWLSRRETRIQALEEMGSFLRQHLPVVTE
jgi:dipeptidyl aminopeptidase/acylaminoacyl peptidase